MSLTSTVLGIPATWRWGNKTTITVAAAEGGSRSPAPRLATVIFRDPLGVACFVAVNSAIVS